MCYGLLNEKVILHQALLSVCLVDVNSIYLSFFISHTPYVLGAQKNRFGEMFFYGPTSRVVVW